MSRNRAFTLIELLVVVAIIAVLISILLPAMQGARDQSKQLLCNTNLRSMGQASYLYAADNNDFIVRAEDYPGRVHFASTLLPGLGYDGSIQGLWIATVREREKIRDIAERIPQFQCPRFPDPRQWLDYVVSAFAVPYTVNNIQRDQTGGGAPGGSYAAEDQSLIDDESFFRMTTFKKVNPSGLVHITEAHVSIPWYTLAYHDTFFASQLPFGAFPRMANDRRHPGGINALFFDGHAQTLRHQTMDSGWGTTLGQRLRYFTAMPPGYD